MYALLFLMVNTLLSLGTYFGELLLAYEGIPFSVDYHSECHSGLVVSGTTQAMLIWAERVNELGLAAT